jgi:hypothetical protein
VISTEDLLWFIDAALDAMTADVVELGDGLANRRPDLAGANSPFAILTHSLGVVEFWGGHVIAGRPSWRDRDAEFRASGSVAVLAEQAREARDQLGLDLKDLDPSAPPRGDVDPDDAVLPEGRTQGGALVHILEELAQHRGQLEITRDLLRGS